MRKFSLVVAAVVALSLAMAPGVEAAGRDREVAHGPQAARQAHEAQGAQEVVATVMRCARYGARSVCR